MPNYKTILEKLNLASEDENNLHCIKVLDQLTSLFETMELKNIPKAQFSELINRLDGTLAKDTIYVRQLAVLKTDISELLRKEFGLTTRLYFRSKWTLNSGLLIGMPVGMITGAIYGYESIFNWITPIGILFGCLIGFFIGKRKDDIATKKGTRLEVI
jgi:hypothetical protein